MPGETDYSIDAGYFTSAVVEDFPTDGVGIISGKVLGVGPFYGLCQFKCLQAQGATISSAIWSGEGFESGTITVYGVKHPNVPWPPSASTANGFLSALTSASSSWSSGTGADSVDVTAIIQELVNQASWSPSNYLMLLFENASSSTYQSWDADGTDPVVANRPTLTINGGGGGTGGGGNGPGPGGQVATSASFFMQLIGGGSE